MYVNKMTFGKYLRMGLVSKGTNHVIRGLELLVSSSDLDVRSKERRGPGG